MFLDGSVTPSGNEYLRLLAVAYQDREVRPPGLFGWLADGERRLHLSDCWHPESAAGLHRATGYQMLTIPVCLHCAQRWAWAMAQAEDPDLWVLGRPDLLPESGPEQVAARDRLIAAVEDVNR